MKKGRQSDSPVPEELLQRIEQQWKEDDQKTKPTNHKASDVNDVHAWMLQEFGIDTSGAESKPETRTASVGEEQIIKKPADITWEDLQHLLQHGATHDAKTGIVSQGNETVGQYSPSTEADIVKTRISDGELYAELFGNTGEKGEPKKDPRHPMMGARKTRGKIPDAS